MLLSLVLCALTTPTAQAADATTLELNSGNNLVSFSVLPSDPTIEETLSGVDQDVVFIKGESQFTILNDGEWIGNIDRMEHTRGYWVNLNLTEPTELEVLGFGTDPDIRYQLHPGHNLISFPCHEEVDIADALPDYAVASVESVITAGLGAFQSNGVWSGNLTYFQPNVGYTLTLTQAVSDFSFVCPNGDGSDPHTYGCLDSFATNYDAGATVNDGSCTYNVPTDWTLSPFKSEAFYFLNDVRIDGEPIDPAADAVAVFQGSSLLGFGYTRDGWSTVVGMEGNASATVQFKVYDASEDTIVDLTVGTEPSYTDGHTFYGGCMDPTAFNYTDLADFNLGNCIECMGDSDCDDSGTGCTPNVCVSGTCEAKALDCDDGDACTNDFCVEPGDCEHEAVETGECATETVDPGIPSAPETCGCNQRTGPAGWAWLSLLLALAWRGRRTIDEHRVRSTA